MFDLRTEVAAVAVFHDDTQMLLSWGEEGVLVAHNVRVLQLLQKIYLSLTYYGRSRGLLFHPANDD